MDALLISLHSLSLLPPGPSQLLQLLSIPPTVEEEDKQLRDLARVLSLGSYDKDAIEGDLQDGDDAFGAHGFGMERELIEDAIVEMIKTFKGETSRLRSAYQAEEKLRVAPQPLPKHTPLHFLKLRHDSAVRQSQRLNSIYGGYRPRLIFSGGESYSSSADLADLAPVSRKEELQVGSRLQGRYVVGRVVSSIIVYVGASFLLNLPAPFGFSLPVSMSHFTKNPRMPNEEASALLPIGTLIAIKEPYVSPNHSLRAGGTAGGVGIRIDTPTDVTLLQAPGSIVAEGSDGWRAKYLEPLQWITESESPAKARKAGRGAQKGGERRREGSSASEEAKDANSIGAVSTHTLQSLWLQEGPLSQARSCGGSTSPSRSLPESLSMARHFMTEERPGAAWRELAGAAGSSLLPERQPMNQSTETLELKGDILLAMSAWEEAEIAFSNAASNDDGSTNSKALQEKLAQARQRKAEAVSGPSISGSTVASIYRSHLSSAAPRIPAADWLSPALKVVQIPEAGRGFITTRSVTAGEPLLMAKSRGSSYPSDDELDYYCPIIRCDFQYGSISTTTQITATTKLIHHMIDRPELTPEILGLTAGPGLSDSRWVEEGHFEKATACITTEQNLNWMRPDRLGPPGGINSLYVDEVLRHNAFGPGLVQRGSVTVHHSTAGHAADHWGKDARRAQNSPSLPRALHRKLAQDPPSAFSRSTQPHPLPAILNHSCLSNVSSVFLGDIVLTKALRNLKEGEEIAHEYVRGGLDYQTRQATLSKHGFVCGCALCDLDRQDGDARLATRRKLFAVQAPALFSRSDALLAHTNGSRVPTEAGDDSEDREKHRDIREALESFAGQLGETYDEERGELRPEMRETYERIGRHAEREGMTAQSVKSYLLSLQSVDAHLSPIWTDYLPSRIADEPSSGLTDSLASMTSHTSTTSTVSSMAITQCPALHVDEAQRTLWRLAQLFANLIPAPDHAETERQQSRTLSLHFSRTAYHVHGILIGGGFEVFEDRWGPSGLDEGGSGLQWRQAWDIWMEDEYPILLERLEERRDDRREAKAG